MMLTCGGICYQKCSPCKFNFSDQINKMNDFDNCSWCAVFYISGILYKWILKIKSI